MIALRERPLDPDRTFHRLEGAVEFNQESVTDGFNLGAVEARQYPLNIRRCSSSSSKSEGFVALRTVRCNRPCR